MYTVFFFFLENILHSNTSLTLSPTDYENVPFLSSPPPVFHGFLLTRFLRTHNTCVSRENTIIMVLQSASVEMRGKDILVSSFIQIEKKTIKPLNTLFFVMHFRYALKISNIISSSL